MITDPKMPLYESDSEEEPNDLAAPALKKKVNEVSGKMFDGIKRGFMKDNKQKTTDESSNFVKKMQKEEDKLEQKQAKQKVKKISKQDEFESPMPERPAVDQKKEELQAPIKCVKCSKMIKPNDPCYKIDCSNEGLLYLDASCYNDEMARQGKTKKRDQKDAMCPTDSCPGQIYEIFFRNSVDRETTYLVCNARPAKTIKADKKMLKKVVKHNESTNNASLEESTSETTESSKVDAQQEVEEVKEPEAPPKPIDLDAPVHRLEKHDEIADKYGLNEQGKEIGKKDKERKKKNEKTIVKLDMVDKKIEEKAQRRRNESNDFEEHQLRGSRETTWFPSIETNDFPSFAEPRPLSTLRYNANENLEAEMLDQGLFPHVEDLNNLENLVEEIKPFKESILGNCLDSGELHELREVFRLVLSDEQMDCTRSGQKLENVRKSVRNIFHDDHLTSTDGGLAKKFLDLTKWFTISKMGGKILFKKKPQTTILSTSNVLREPTLIAQTTSVSPSIESKPIKSPPTFMEKENLNKRDEPKEISKIGDKLRISTNTTLTCLSTLNDAQKGVNIPTVAPSLGQQHLFENLVFKISANAKMDVPSQPFDPQKVVPSLLTRNQLIPPPGFPNAPTGGFNHPPGIPATSKQVSSTQPTQPMPLWNDMELENNRLKKQLEKALKERDEINNAYQEILRQNTSLYKLNDCLKGEIDVLKTSINAQDERFKEEQNLWAAEKEHLAEKLDRVKLVNDDLKAQLQTELTKLQKETLTAFKRKEFTEGTMQHIDLICSNLQSLLIENRMGADEKDLRHRQLKDLKKIYLDWNIVHQATVKRLYELMTNGTSDTVIPKPPRFTDICTQLYEEFMQKPKGEMKAPANLSFSSFPSTSTHNYGQTTKTSAIRKSGPREIDFATHECKVCFEVLETKENAKQCTDCYEPFHYECIKKWLMQKKSQMNSCPNCKKMWPDEEAYPSL